MGIGRIIENVGEGLYAVALKINVARIKLWIAVLEQRDTDLRDKLLQDRAKRVDLRNAAESAEINASNAYTDWLNSLTPGQPPPPPPSEINALMQAATMAQQELRNQDSRIERQEYLLLSIQKRLNMLRASDQEEIPTMAWCADYSTELAVGATVAMIEPPGGQLQSQLRLNIAPAHGGAARLPSYGQLSPAMSNTPAGWALNYMLMGFTQKMAPTWRYGLISNIDYSAHTCSVQLVSRGVRNLDINQNKEFFLTEVPIQYMSCDSLTFENGDEVIVQFEGFDWAQRKVIGYRREPKRCTGIFIPGWVLVKEKKVQASASGGNIDWQGGKDYKEVVTWFGPRYRYGLGGAHYLNIQNLAENISAAPWINIVFLNGAAYSAPNRVIGGSVLLKNNERYLTVGIISAEQEITIVQRNLTKRTGWTTLEVIQNAQANRLAVGCLFFSQSGTSGRCFFIRVKEQQLVGGYNSTVSAYKIPYYCELQLSVNAGTASSTIIEHGHIISQYDGGLPYGPMTFSNTPLKIAADYDGEAPIYCTVTDEGDFIGDIKRSIEFGDLSEQIDHRNYQVIKPFSYFFILGDIRKNTFIRRKIISERVAEGDQNITSQEMYLLTDDDEISVASRGSGASFLSGEDTYHMSYTATINVHDVGTLRKVQYGPQSVDYIQWSYYCPVIDAHPANSRGGMANHLFLEASAWSVRFIPQVSPSIPDVYEEQYNYGALPGNGPAYFPMGVF